MVSWGEFCAEAPTLAAAVRERFDAHRHVTMATLRRDGAPRISGTEVHFRGDDLMLAGMPQSLKFGDLRRDGRVAVHSGSDDPPAWVADAKVAGVASDVTDEDVRRAFTGSVSEMPPGAFELFTVDVTEVVLVRLGEPADHLVIESWHPGRGLARVERR